MKAIPLILLLHVLVLFRDVHAQDSLPALIRGIRPAVVTISSFDAAGLENGTGTGFLVRSNQIVTNYHVMAGAYRAEVKTAAGNAYPVLGIAAENKPADLVLLSVEISEEMEPLEVRSELPEVGERVIVVGSPFGFEQTVSDGIISSLRLAPGFDTVIQVTAPFRPGSSGSPVVNMDGKVIGVASRQVMEGQNLNFAVPGKWVLSLSPGKTVPLPEWVPTVKTEGTAAVADSTLEALGRKGEALLESGKYEEALACFTKVAEKNPNLAELWVNIGSCQAHLGRWEEAIVVSERAVDLKPDLAVAHFNLGAAYGMRGRWNEALEEYRKSLQSNPDDVLALTGLAGAQSHLGLANDAIETCRKAIRIDPGKPEPYGRLADALLNLGRHEEAVVQTKKALQLNSEFVDAWHTQGLALSHLERHQEAVDAYREALRLSPFFAEAHSNLGLAYAHLERWPQAIEEYKETIRLKPDMVEGHYNLGVAYFRTGDKASALDEYKILQKLDRDLANRLFKVIYK